MEFEQAGQVRAEYGKALIDHLAADLGLRHGKGFSRSNLIRFRQFYLAYPQAGAKGATLSHQLTWSHLVELLKIDDPLERGFYEQQTLREHWSVRERIRQKESALFLRLAASKDKAGILQLAQQGQVVEQPADLLREPYVFEVLKIPEPYQVSETQLETLLCDHLQPFLLELGKGFTFVGRQYRVTVAAATAGGGAGAAGCAERSDGAVGGRKPGEPGQACAAGGVTAAAACGPGAAGPCRSGWLAARHNGSHGHQRTASR